MTLAPSSRSRGVFRASPLRSWRGLAAADPPTGRELLGVGLLLLLCGAALYGSHVVDGNFSYDDWALASLVKYSGYWQAVNFYLHIDHRPLLALYSPLVQLLASEHAHVELAWAAVAYVSMCFSLYLFLRTLSIERIGAAPIALLVLLFPSADGGWMYVIGSPGSVAVSLYLLGATTALHACRKQGKARMRLHALAVLLYVASVLMYELALVAICLTGALYTLYVPWRQALRRWVIDLGAIAITMLLATSRAVPLLPGRDAHAVLPVGQWLTHAKLIYEQGRDVLATSLQPFGGAHYNWVLAAYGGVILAAVLVRARLPSSDPARLQLRRWLLVAAGAFVGLAASWVLLVPSALYYSPLAAGIGSRINAFAGVCICTLAVALAVLVAILVLRLIRRPSSWALLGSLVLCTGIGVGYARRIKADKSDWALASNLQTSELATLHRAVPNPPAGTEFVLFGAPGYVAAGVPVFAAPWDLNGAVQLSWHDYSLTAYPALTGDVPSCGAVKVIPPGSGYSAQQLAVGYGRTLFVNARTGDAVLIRDRAQCEAMLTQFPAGPVLLSG